MSLSGGSEHYTQSRVPASAATVSGLRIAIVKIGVILALPAFITGAQIGFSLGFGRAALAVAIGGVVLGVLTMLTATVGAVSRQSTALIVRYAFGARGARAVSALLGMTLIGFFAVTAEIFGKSSASLIERVLNVRVPASACVVAGGVLMILTSIYGFNGLKRLADVAAPVKLMGLMWIVAIALRDHDVARLLAAPPLPVSLGVGVSAVIGGVAVSAAILPDITRFARTPGHARAAGIASYAIAFPLVLMLAAIPSILTAEADLVEIMISMGLGLPAFLFLIFAAWTTNTSNLYSAGLGLSSLLGGFSFPLVAAAAGAAGVVLALVGITEWLLPFLLFLGIGIPPIAGVYLADFYVIRRQRYDEHTLLDSAPISWRAIASWGAGVALGAATAFGWIRLTGVPSIDSILAAFGLYSLMGARQSRSAPVVEQQP